MNGRTNSGTTVLNGSDIALEPITEFSLSGRDSSVLINWADPVDKYTNPGNELVIEWDHTVIIRKQGSAPTSIKDGTVVVESYTRNQYRYEAFTDTGLTNDVEYYYAAYSVTTVGAYSDIAIKSITPRMGFVFLTDSSTGGIAETQSGGYGGHIRGTVGNKFVITKNNGYTPMYFDRDLTKSTFNLDFLYFNGSGIGLSDGDHLICVEEERNSSFPTGNTICLDSDLVRQDLENGKIDDEAGAVFGDNFVIGGVCTYGSPVYAYDRNTLTLSYDNYYAMGGQYDRDRYQDGDAAVCGNYIVFLSGSPGNNSFSFDENFVATQISVTGNVSGDHLSTSLGLYGIFFYGYGNEIHMVDDDLIFHDTVNTTPHAVHNTDVIACNGLGIIAGGAQPFDSHPAYYDFTAIDSDMMILNRGIDKMKYRRTLTSLGVLDQKLIITSSYADKNNESASFDDVDTCPVEVYTF